MADSETVITYEAARSNAQKIEDAGLRERVLRGIEEVTAALGPDWLDTIDPSELLMDSPNQCVLGQAFENHRPTSEQWDWVTGIIPYDGPFNFAAAGYWKGLAILDGEVMHSPAAYGFDDVHGDYNDLTEAWMTVLGADE